MAVGGTWELLREGNFRRFWLAGVVSQAGSGVGGVALPLTAVSLGASAMDMGILAAMSQVPVLVLALHAGVWVDRLPRRPIMIFTNVGRGFAMLIIPLAWWAGVLEMGVLWVTALVVGILAVVFDLAITSYPPTLVAREQLGEANSVLTAGGSAAQIVGRGAAGWIVNAVTAPVAIVVDAVSFVAAAAVVATVRVPETHEVPPRRGMSAEIREGVATVWHDPILRSMIAATTIASFGGAIAAAVFVLFAVRDVGLSAPALGLVLSAGSAFGLAGSMLAGRISRRLQPGLAMAGAQAAAVAGGVLIAASPRGHGGLVVIAAGQAMSSGALAVFSVIQISLRQGITPTHVLGRVNAVRRVTVFGVIPLGALLGGYVGDTFTLRSALVVSAMVSIVALAVMVSSPLRHASTLTRA